MLELEPTNATFLKLWYEYHHVYLKNEINKCKNVLYYQNATGSLMKIDYGTAGMSFPEIFGFSHVTSGMLTRAQM